jgi:hypothetical protein
MRFVLTKHAQIEMMRRRIPEALVNQIAQIVTVYKTSKIGKYWRTQ